MANTSSPIAHGSGQFRAQSISIQVSDRERCNASCKFCISRTTPGAPIDYRHVKTCDPARLRVGLRVAERMGATHAILTGRADPSQEDSPYLEQLVGMCSEHLPLVDMHTNGFLFLPTKPKHDLLPTLVRAGLTQITLSIASHDLPTNRKLMGQKESPAVPAFIAYLRSLGLLVRASLVINRSGVHTYEGIIDYISILGNMGVQMVVIREVWIPDTYAPIDPAVHHWNRENHIDIGQLQAEFDEIASSGRNTFMRHGNPLPWGTPVYLVDSLFADLHHGVNVTFARCEEANGGTVIKSIVHKPDGHGYRNWDHTADILY